MTDFWEWEGGNCKLVRVSNLLFFSPSLENSSTQGKEAQSASVSAKDHDQHLSFRVLGQNSYHSKGTRCFIWKIRNLTLLLQIVIYGSVRTQRERTRRFLFSASCLIFFYYYVQRFFYTKKLNAVLIKSVCSFNWDSCKSEDFVRNKCKLFLKFFEIVDSLCLQWNHTPWQLVDHIFLHLSNLHSTIFIFLPRDKLSLFEIWDTVSSLVHLFKSLPTWCGNPSLDVTTLHLRLVRVTCKSYGFHYQNFKILNVDGVSFRSHQRCLPSSPAKKCQFETVPRLLELGQGLWAACCLSVRCRKHLWLFWI